ncbi:hypothetical protein ACFSKI_16520 [Pseudogracilibacillus auburnensis]|uniref:Uncharacterized protein n=1 Tax=Pseudogracilibacillus auburnensis TaxID=1494959 RepID=A0A2V3W8B9_9BACI|nr:hypothetical protein [Pseudogracilibacillus auburnensis]PXW89428.1 hypothetical protein DFR56_102205 [Pseudogracilibacillus auburnensis]
MLAEMKEELVDMIAEIAEDEEFASIHDITYNDDFTKIHMVVDQEMFENSFDGFVTTLLRSDQFILSSLQWERH